MDNIGLVVAVWMLVLTLQDLVQLVELVNNSYSITSVTDFSWLDYPNITWSSWRFLLFGATTALIIFFRLIGLDHLLTLLEVLNEIFIFLIVQSLLYMEGER